MRKPGLNPVLGWNQARIQLVPLVLGITFSNFQTAFLSKSWKNKVHIYVPQNGQETWKKQLPFYSLYLLQYIIENFVMLEFHFYCIMCEFLRDMKEF